jgi:hypothetical protein
MNLDYILPHNWIYFLKFGAKNLSICPTMIQSGDFFHWHRRTRALIYFFPPIFATWAMDINAPHDWFFFLSRCKKQDLALFEDLPSFNPK